MMRGTLLSLPLLALCTGPAHADSACDKPHNDFDGLFCLSKIYQQADLDLNANYGKLRQKLSPASQSKLRTSQIAWQQARNTQCSRQEPTGFYVDMSCTTRMTIARNRFLEDRTRECVSTGCLDSRLSQVE